MKCPECSIDLQHVAVISECIRTGHLDDNGVVIGYEKEPEIWGTLRILCPQCDSVLKFTYHGQDKLTGELDVSGVS